MQRLIGGAIPLPPPYAFVACTGTLPFQQQQQYCLQFSVRFYRHQSQLRDNFKRNVNVRGCGLDSPASQLVALAVACGRSDGM